MKKQARLLIVMLVVLLIPATAFAGSPWTQETTYGAKATGKLTYGFKNLLGGWTEIFTQPMHYHKDGKNVFEGMMYGLVYGVTDTVGGALHVVTFPITNVDVPLPHGGVDFE